MSSLTPVPSRSSRFPLFLGIVLVVLGLLLLFPRVWHWNLTWIRWRFVVPMLLAAWGISSLWRYFSYTAQQAEQGMRRTGGLVWGSFLLFIALAWLGRLRGGFGGVELAGKFWPLLLVVIGLGKIVDFYQLRGRARIRFREVLGVLLIILFGWLAGHAALFYLHAPGVVLPLRIRGYDIRIEDFLGRPFTFSEDKILTLSPSRVSVSNRFGDIRVTRGPAGQVAVRLEKVVYRNDHDYGEASRIAGRIQLISQGSDHLELRVNRRELGDPAASFRTNMEIRLPEKTNLDLDNAFGSVTAGGLDTPGMNVKAQEGDIELSDITGDVVTENSHHLTRLKNIGGVIQVTARHGSLQISGAGSDVHIDALNTRVELSRVKGKCDVRDSHRQVLLEEIEGDVAVTSSHGDVTLRRLQSAVTVDADHASVTGEDLRRGINVTGQGTRVSLSRVEGPVRVTTSLRNVQVDAVRGPVEITTRNGNVRINATGPLEGPVRVTADNGDVVLRLPEAARATLDLQASYGAIDNSLSETMSVTRAGSSAALRGTFNGGGPQITVQTRHGSIRLER